jgi:hypothetical protein
MVDIEKFIKKIELESYVKEILAEMIQILDKKIKQDMPGVKIAIKIGFVIAGTDSTQPKEK